MKELLVITITLFSFYTMQAQYSTANTDKNWNRFVLGGSANFHYRASGEARIFHGTSKGYEFRPYFGKVLSDRWIAGIELTVGQRHLERVELDQGNRVNVIQRELDFGVELFGRYTFNPKNKLQVYLRPYVAYSHHENKIDQYGVSDIRSDINFGVDLGLTYQISKRINLTANIANLNVGGGLYNSATGFGGNVDLNIQPSNITLGAEIKF